MKITFLGAAHEVTGSCTLIEIGDKHILVDCGMEQGVNIFENQKLPINPLDIDCVFLTHAHIDHSGNLPLLYKNGFRGSIYATEATCNLCNIMLLDCAHIQMFEAEWRNRKAKRSGKEEYVPIYTMEDAQGAISKLHPYPYNKIIPISENVEIRFNDMGHLLGSSSIEIWLTENEIKKKIVFSGDVGNINQPIIKDPMTIKQADYVVIESTYGNRYHEKSPDYVAALSQCIQRTFDRGGNVVIPSFAVGRTQEMLYFLRQIKDNNLIKGHDSFPVYVDSPLAEEATSIFMQCDEDYFDDDAKALLHKGINPLYFDGLEVAVTSDDSKAINDNPTPKVIISASGMCEAGRIRHHLKHNLWKKENLILFVGYQSNGTLGRLISDGAKTVKLFGEEVTVNAEIQTLAGISGHADKQGLLNWINSFEEKPQKVFVNHGEDETCTEFTQCLRNEYNFNATAPYSGTIYDLATGDVIVETTGVRINKEKPLQGTRVSVSFNRLINAANRLLSVSRHCEGMSNKDLDKLSEQIESLSNKWSK